MFKILIFTAFLILNVFGVECGNESSMGSYVIEKAKEKNIKVKNSNQTSYKGFQTAYGYAYVVYYKNDNKSKKAWMIPVTLKSNCEVLFIGSSQQSDFVFDK